MINSEKKAREMKKRKKYTPLANKLSMCLSKERENNKHIRVISVANVFPFTIYISQARAKLISHI